jgi:excisionase family DNA binding protein
MTRLTPVPFVVKSEEVPKIKAINTLLTTSKNESTIKVTTKEGEEITLPPSLSEALYAIAEIMARGKAVSLLPLGTSLTATEAAELLNVSRPYLQKLLDKEELPYHMVGTHRRLQIEDVITYKQKMMARSKEGLRKLAQYTQEQGLYDINYSDKE